MKIFAFSLILLISACHKDQPQAPTARQSDQLNEAEDLLNTMSESGPQNEEGPEAKAPDPSVNQN